MVHLGFYTHLFGRKTHGRTQVVQRVDRRYREVTALDRRAVARVAIFNAAIRVPGALVRVDLVERTLHVVIPRNMIENEELVLRAEIGRIGYAG